MSFSLTDHGGHQAEIDFLNSLEGQEMLLEEDRAERLRNLTGKYVITTTGFKSGKSVYYQAERFKRRKNDYWTQYLSNAVPFSSKESAKRIQSRLKYGNPVVCKVLQKGQLKPV